MTKIEWTEATWNPLAGCSLVSPGCTNCYAMRMAARLEAMGDAAVKAGRDVPAPPNTLTRFIAADGRDVTAGWLDSDLAMEMWLAGKARAGRVLDLRTHDAMPTPAQREVAA